MAGPSGPPVAAIVVSGQPLAGAVVERAVDVALASCAVSSAADVTLTQVEVPLAGRRVRETAR